MASGPVFRRERSLSGVTPRSGGLQAKGSIFICVFPIPSTDRSTRPASATRKTALVRIYASRLVLLDLFCANQDLKYFETEKDNVRFSVTDCGVLKGLLFRAKVRGEPPIAKPTLRIFVDKALKCLLNYVRSYNGDFTGGKTV